MEKTLPWATAIEEKPLPVGCSQSLGGPPSGQVVSRPVSDDMPSRLSPRQPGQSVVEAALFGKALAGVTDSFCSSLSFSGSWVEVSLGTSWHTVKNANVAQQ